MGLWGHIIAGGTMAGRGYIITWGTEGLYYNMGNYGRVYIIIWGTELTASSAA